MAFRVSAGNDDRSMSIDVAVSVANGRVLAVVATEASASGVGRSGLEKRREEARNTDVTAVVNVRKNSLVNPSSSPFSRRAANTGCVDVSCGRLAVTDLVLGIVNASAPLRQDDTVNETAAMATRKQR